MKELIAGLDGQIIGRVVRDARGRISLTYANDYRNSGAEGAETLPKKAGGTDLVVLPTTRGSPVPRILGNGDGNPNGPPVQITPKSASHQSSAAGVTQITKGQHCRPSAQNMER